ncbi:MAG TPA: helicase-related protein [Bacteroidales bacterium]|nr:helicase-related protein [Bacteroidales bacterium]
MTEYKPGKLVHFRDREWTVLPSADAEVVILKPMGGSEEEITGVYLPLQSPGDQIKEARFPNPGTEDLDDFQTAKMLFDATRLSFRNASGPFRCMGKLSFRPRSYQVVPLVMALKQDKVRLLIADDVGVGKTVEALIILKELMERGEVKRFAVVCLPHLCEQWQQELKDKLDIQAEIIRSSTAASLDRKLPDDRSVFYHIPYQVISIDYIKSDKRREFFYQDCPELVIVDEVHSCARPAGAKYASQQQRYNMLYQLVRKKSPHLVFLTATPHSGKDEEFQSILGILDPELETFSLQDADQNKRRKIAKYFIQRKRENITRWLKEETPFPKRDTKEVPYSLSPEYSDFYDEILEFARGLTRENSEDNVSRMRYWAALALLRGVMSSPAAGYEMLKNRHFQQGDDEITGSFPDQVNPLFESDTSEVENDAPPTEYVDQADLDTREWSEIGKLALKIQSLYGLDKDIKVKRTIEIIQEWLKKGFHPIIFCKYIQTAKYVGKILKEVLPSKVDVQVITSELADEQRREKIDLMENSPQRVMVATDCLSEGINLQALFTAVLHYDLPWNPNRLEQREGRVDRFGQTAKEVKAYLLFGQDNLIDRKVLEILIQKVRDIQRSTGVSIVLGEGSTNIMESLIKDILLGSGKQTDKSQLSMFADEFYRNELETIRKKAENLRSIFAHEAIPSQEIEQDLKEVDESIGDLKSVEEFVKMAVIHLGGIVQYDGTGYQMTLTNLPEHLKLHFPQGKNPKVSFQSPTPPGYRYIGRNHQFVEQLCQLLISLAFEPRPGYKRVARASVIQTGIVDFKTTLIQFRVRNVIKEVNSMHEVISEEMCLWGYRGSGDDSSILNHEEAKKLLLEATSKTSLPIAMQQDIFGNEQQIFVHKQKEFFKVAEDRAEHLVEMHGKFKELVGGKRYEAVYPVLPPDLMGVYILNPAPRDLF